MSELHVVARVETEAGKLESATMSRKEKRAARGRLSHPEWIGRALVGGAIVAVLINFAADKYGEQTGDVKTQLVNAQKKASELNTTVSDVGNKAVDGFCASITVLEQTHKDAVGLNRQLGSIAETAKRLGLTPTTEATGPTLPTTTLSTEIPMPERLAQFVEACKKQ